MSQPLSMLYVAKIAFAQSKCFPSEHDIPIRETKIHWNKQHKQCVGPFNNNNTIKIELSQYKKCVL